jgi:hypothetical protein
VQGRRRNGEGSGHRGVVDQERGEAPVGQHGCGCGEGTQVLEDGPERLRVLGSHASKEFVDDAGLVTIWC